MRSFTQSLDHFALNFGRSFWGLAFALVTACSSFQIEDFKEVRIGMDRSDVIDSIGSPYSTQKRGDLNVWTYRLTNDGKALVVREVHFKNDHVVYAGEPIDWSTVPRRGKANVEPIAAEGAAEAPKFEPVKGE